MYNKKFIKELRLMIHDYRLMKAEVADMFVEKWRLQIYPRKGLNGMFKLPDAGGSE